MEINRGRLANGLRIVHHKNSSTGNVTINMLYGVGSRNEEDHKTGLAHMLEHMMFCGSANIENFDEPLERIGGYSNAFTSADITNYYLTLPKENIETGFWLESDRMLKPSLTARSFRVQKQVVLEEFKETLNQPYGDVSQLVNELCYEKHPYRHRVIGATLSQVERLTLTDVREFFKRYYAPDNAVLSVVGDAEWERVMELSEKWFGSIRPRKAKAEPRPIRQEPEQTAPRERTYFADAPRSAIYRLYHMCSCTDDEIYACDLLSDILANGKSARLPQRLVYDEKLFITADACINVNLDPALFMITGKVADDADINLAAESIDREAELLMDELVSEEELEKWKNCYEMDVMASRFDIEQIAADLAFDEFAGRPEHLNEMIDKYRALTPEDIRETARKIFRRENASTLYYIKRG